MMSEFAIEMLGITKTFGILTANDNIDLKVRKGEIHALLGENGAGKSTLMSILFGMYSPDRGKILIHGEERKITGPRMATECGIGMVHQHFQLVRNFTVLENIILGVETVNKGIVCYEEAKKKVMELSERYRLNIDPDAVVSDISVGMQQRVEIIKMLYRDNDILIFDEPTAVLTPQEIDELVEVIKELKREGKSIIFITHKLKEIKALCDRCTILRKGRYIDTVSVADVSAQELAEMMVGRKLENNYNRQSNAGQDVVMKVSGLTIFSPDHKKKVLDNISFSLKRGEILCIAGIDGNGQNELVEAITGLRQSNEGTIHINNVDITNSSIHFRNTHGLSCIPEDRHKYGLVLGYTLEQNLLLKKYKQKPFSNHGLINFRAWKAHAEQLVDEYDIRSARGCGTVAKEMSGGNQQKIVVAREIDADAEVLIAVQPTRGLDVGAVEGIHKSLFRQVEKNKGVLLISFELDEVFKISDRILVMYEGQIVGEFDPKETTAEELGLYMSGAKRMEVCQ